MSALVTYCQWLKRYKLTIFPEINDGLCSCGAKGLSGKRVRHDQEMISSHFKVCPVIGANCRQLLEHIKMARFRIPPVDVTADRMVTIWKRQGLSSVLTFRMFCSKAAHIKKTMMCLKHIVMPQIITTYKTCSVVQDMDSLCPSEAIWHLYGPTLSHAMACCLAAPSHCRTSVDLSSVTITWAPFY